MPVIPPSPSRTRCPTADPKTEVACQDCGLFGILGVISNREYSDEETLEQVLKRRQPVPKGEYLFRTGQTFESVYAVKGGAFKTVALLEGGDEQVIGFHLPGELLGLESARSPAYSFTAEALEPSSVCELRFGELGMLAEHCPELQEQLIRLMSSQIAREQCQAIIMARQSAEERLAGFLLSLSQRLSVRMLPSLEFRMAMSRKDIASHLGLAVETVSRLFTRLEREEILAVSGKQIRLQDLKGLMRIARAPQHGETLHPPLI